MGDKRRERGRDRPLTRPPDVKRPCRGVARCRASACGTPGGLLPPTASIGAALTPRCAASGAAGVNLQVGRPFCERGESEGGGRVRTASEDHRLPRKISSWWPLAWCVRPVWRLANQNGNSTHPPPHPTPPPSIKETPSRNPLPLSPPQTLSLRRPDPRKAHRPTHACLPPRDGLALAKRSDIAATTSVVATGAPTAAAAAAPLWPPPAQCCRSAQGGGVVELQPLPLNVRTNCCSWWESLCSALLAGGFGLMPSPAVRWDRREKAPSYGNGQPCMNEEFESPGMLHIKKAVKQIFPNLIGHLPTDPAEQPLLPFSQERTMAQTAHLATQGSGTSRMQCKNSCPRGKKKTGPAVAPAAPLVSFYAASPVRHRIFT